MTPFDYDNFDALRRDVNDVASLLHTYHHPANTLALRILDDINRAQSHAEAGNWLTVEVLVDKINTNMVELRALVSSANG